MMAVLSLLLALLPTTSYALYDFTPENYSTVYDVKLPSQVSMAEAQLAAAGFNSYWSSHFLTTANGTEYALMSQGVVLPTNHVTFRTSLLDVANPENYWQSGGSVPLQNNSTTKNGKLNIKGMGYEFSSDSDDNFATMISGGSTDDYEYNLTVKATSKIILNAGTGYFDWGASNTTQLSLPSCQTSGTLVIANSSFEVNGENSMTWYDRQYGGPGTDSGFTWFGVQFPGSDIKASMWFSDNEKPEERLRFATVRTGSGLSIVRFNVTTNPDDKWTSPASNNTYQTKWFIDFDNGDFLEVASVRKDQEIYVKGFLAQSAFSSVKGRFFGQKRGFAIVDIVPDPTV